MTSAIPSVLYISYDGMLEPLGQSQVLNYVEKLAADYRVHLISFEKKNDRQDSAKMQAALERMNDAGISWTPLTYHKAPTAPATVFDIAIGTMVALWISVRRKVKIIHARSYVSALMASEVKRITGIKFLFDMRGFWADERIDGGVWPAKGRLYRITKGLERRFLLSADHVVTLTHRSVQEISGFPYLDGQVPPITVIPTCANLERFNPRQRNSGNQFFTLGYVGSAGTWYLIEEMLAFYRAILQRRPDARLLVVNRGQHDVIRTAVEAAGVDPTNFEIVSADHHDVPDYISRMTVGAAIIRPVYSKMASAPTKLAEYLGCGIPCIGNINVGDMESILEGERVGVALRDFSESDHAEAADRLLELLEDSELENRCVDTANRLFSLESGVAAYREIYRSLI